MRRIRCATLAILWLCLAILTACAEPQGQAKLANARHAIPVFEPSQLVSTEAYAFSKGSDFADLHDYAGTRWELTTTRPYTEVVAFYMREMPRTPDDMDDLDWLDDDDDEPACESEFWSIQPEGAGDDLNIEITVEQTTGHGAKIIITESARV